ncbi:response regulator transcription factor [Candidatus Nitrospira bockiana]
MSTRILLVEDDRETQEVVKRLLEASGYSVEAVTSGAEALGTLQLQRFDGIVLDMGLPDVDGMSVIRQLRQTAAAPPVVILTAYHELGLRGVAEGARAFLTKPFDARHLRQVTCHWFLRT